MLAGKFLKYANNCIAQNKEESEAMAMSIIQSPMTGEQVEGVVEAFRSELRHYQDKVSSRFARQVLDQTELGKELVLTFRKCVDAISETIIRRVRVDRSLKPQEMIDATGFFQLEDTGRPVIERISNIATMLNGKGEEVDVSFFCLGRFVTDIELAHEYENRGFVPDPYAQAQVNADDPLFAYDYPNGTHWQDGNGFWHFISFSYLIDRSSRRIKRIVRVDRVIDGWNRGHWFGGVRR
jgi:hypothetical protein